MWGVVAVGLGELRLMHELKCFEPFKVAAITAICLQLLLLAFQCNSNSILSLQVLIYHPHLAYKLGTTMAVKNTPIYVFVPGAWHTPDTFDGIRALLSKRGHDSEAINLPSVGAAEPTKSGLHADIAHTYVVLRALADQGRQIIVVMHSYGGMVGSGAVEGLGYEPVQSWPAWRCDYDGVAGCFCGAQGQVCH
jgi:hypothetical protein